MRPCLHRLEDMWDEFSQQVHEMEQQRNQAESTRIEVRQYCNHGLHVALSCASCYACPSCESVKAASTGEQEELHHATLSAYKLCWYKHVACLMQGDPRATSCIAHIMFEAFP